MVAISFLLSPLDGGIKILVRICSILMRMLEQFAYLLSSIPTPSAKASDNILCFIANIKATNISRFPFVASP